MGAYVNPRNESKEMWLTRFAEMVDWKPGEELPSFVSFTREGNLPVILVDNGLFTAAGIGFDEREYKMMTDCTTDTREKLLFSAPKDKLLEVSNLKDYLKAA